MARDRSGRATVRLAIGPRLRLVPRELGVHLADSGYVHRDAKAWALPLHRAGDYRALYSIDDRRQPSLSWRLPTAVTPTSHGDVQPHPAAVSRPIGTPR